MYLLDTNTVIDFFNAKLPENAKNLLLTIEKPKISVITRIELFSSTKIPIQEKNILESFVNQAKVYDTINLDIINQSIFIRQNHKIKLPDAIIAATALVYNLTIISRNVSDFKNIQGVQVIDPHSL
ncbi:type II toxin-antitoxin system VapC family toxin [Flavobacterium psychrophilum]